METVAVVPRRTRATRAALVATLVAVTAFTMAHEGYVALVSPALALSMIAGFGVIAWLAASERPSRLAALLLSILVIEYVKESIGVRAGLWTYHGNPGQYLFGVWLWVMAGTSAYAVAKKVAVPLVARSSWAPPRWTHAALVLAVAAVIPLSLGGYRPQVGTDFVLLYAVLTAAAVASAVRMPFPTLAGLVLTAWAVANPAEYVGSMGSGIWTYARDARYPPLFLLFGCWPLEILAQVSLSAVLAAEPLDLSPAAPAEEPS